MIRRAKIIKNHKIKNTPSILSSLKMSQKIQKNEKNENFVIFYDFGDRSTRGFTGIQFLKKINSRVYYVMDLKKQHDFS